MRQETGKKGRREDEKTKEDAHSARHSSLITHRSSLSVAMCTYNGAAYLPEQLESLANQSRLPDELVICDDVSQDATVEIIEAFAARVSFPVRLFRNATNLGSTKNFEKAISLCQGDIIALADQDDVWQPEKIEREAAALEALPAAGLVFTNAEVVDQTLTPLPPDIWTRVGFTPAIQTAFREGEAFAFMCSRNAMVWTGATLMFRARFRDAIIPIPVRPTIHDAWIALVVSGLSDVTFLDEPLLRYRQHGGQQLGAPGETPSIQAQAASLTPDVRARKRTHLEQHLAMLETLHARLSAARNQDLPGLTEGETQRITRKRDANIAHVAAHAAHVRRRLALPSAFPLRLPLVLRELARGDYSRYSNGIRSAALDLKPSL